MPVSEKERELVRFIMGNASNRNRDLARMESKAK